MNSPDTDIGRRLAEWSSDAVRLYFQPLTAVLRSLRRGNQDPARRLDHVSDAGPVWGPYDVTRWFALFSLAIIAFAGYLLTEQETDRISAWVGPGSPSEVTRGGTPPPPRDRPPVFGNPDRLPPRGEGYFRLTGDLNMRSGPGMRHPVVAILLRDAVVQLGPANERGWAPVIDVYTPDGVLRIDPRTSGWNGLHVYTRAGVLSAERTESDRADESTVPSATPPR